MRTCTILVPRKKCLFSSSFLNWRFLLLKTVLVRKVQHGFVRKASVMCVCACVCVRVRAIQCSESCDSGRALPGVGLEGVNLLYCG